MLVVFARLVVGTNFEEEVCLLQLPRSQSFLRRNEVEARTIRGDASAEKARRSTGDASTAEVVRVAAAARAARSGAARAPSCTRGDKADYLPCTSLMEPYDTACQDRTAGLRLGSCEDAMWEVSIPAGTMTITFEAAVSGQTEDSLKIKTESASGWSTIATIDSCSMNECTEVFDVEAGNLVIDSTSGTKDVESHFLITSLVLS